MKQRAEEVTTTIKAELKKMSTEMTTTMKNAVNSFEGQVQARFCIDEDKMKD